MPKKGHRAAPPCSSNVEAPYLSAYRRIEPIQSRKGPNGTKYNKELYHNSTKGPPKFCHGIGPVTNPAFRATMKPKSGGDCEDHRTGVKDRQPSPRTAAAMPFPSKRAPDVKMVLSTTMGVKTHVMARLDSAI